MENQFEPVCPSINTPDSEETDKPAKPLHLLFDLTSRHGQKPEFAGSYLACMKAPFPGSSGHAAMVTENLTAVEALKEKDFTFHTDTAACDGDRRVENAYLNGEYNGFAIHFLRKG